MSAMLCLGEALVAAARVATEAGARVTTVGAVSGEDLDAAVDAASGLCLSATTLASESERALTMRARARALEQQRPVLLDVDLRLDRWRSRADAAAAANACVPAALFVCAPGDAAAILTGEDDPERAALALRKGGAELVVLTLGEGGAMLRGGPGLRVDRPGHPDGGLAAATATTAARGAFTGTLIAALERSRYYPAAAATALGEALTAAAAAGAR